MLVMMIPGANAAFRNNRQQEVATQHNKAIYGEVEDEVQSCKSENQEYR
jgi:hypothetical protein